MKSAENTWPQPTTYEPPATNKGKMRLRVHHWRRRESAMRARAPPGQEIIFWG